MQCQCVEARVHVTGTGAEHFELDLGPWSVLGNRALSVDAGPPPERVLVSLTLQFRAGAR